MKTDFEKYALEKRNKLSTYFELNWARLTISLFLAALAAHWFEINIIYLGIITAIVAVAYLTWAIIGFVFWAKEKREFTEELQGRLKKLRDRINSKNS